VNSKTITITTDPDFSSNTARLACRTP